MQLLASHRVGEPYLGSMKTKTLTLETIELVAHDGAAQTIRMGTMDAQLVGATGLRIKGNNIRGKRRMNEFIVGDGTLAMLQIHHLARTVHGVGAQGQADAPFGRK